ncbi:MAG TPA: alpha/beta hydrolase [Azospirillaceae bacterium]|nr:alpha/beta hydrolase [Azospirillaceae bacterium]
MQIPTPIDGFVEAGGRRLEVRRFPATRPGAPPMVFLHEGLGSIGLWRDTPGKLAAATGGEAIVYSRQGYGRSEPPSGPRGLDYLHREALGVLPELLDRLGIERPVLVGHSDGGSIALIHAAHAAGAARPPTGLIVEAAHVFVEDVTLAGIRDAVAAYRTTPLRDRLARYHDDVDHVFHAWADTWLSPPFRDWNIEALLPQVACPILVIQGDRDEYGTPAQVEAIAAQVSGPARTFLVPDCGHTPHRERADVVLPAMAAFLKELEDRR